MRISLWLNWWVCVIGMSPLEGDISDSVSDASQHNTLTHTHTHTHTTTQSLISAQVSAEEMCASEITLNTSRFQTPLLKVIQTRDPGPARM